MTEWSSFSAPSRSFLAQSPQVNIRIGPTFCVWSILTVDCLHAKKFLPTRHSSGDMTDENGRKFEKNGLSVISPLSKYQHWHLGLPDSGTAHTNCKNFSRRQKFFVRNDGKNDGCEEKMTVITKKWRLRRHFQKKFIADFFLYFRLEDNKQYSRGCYKVVFYFFEGFFDRTHLSNWWIKKLSKHVGLVDKNLILLQSVI